MSEYLKRILESETVKDYYVSIFPSVDPKMGDLLEILKELKAKALISDIDVQEDKVVLVGVTEDNIITIKKILNDANIYSVGLMGPIHNQPDLSE